MLLSVMSPTSHITSHAEGRKARSGSAVGAHCVHLGGDVMRVAKKFPNPTRHPLDGAGWCSKAAQRTSSPVPLDFSFLFCQKRILTLPELGRFLRSGKF